MKDILDEAIKHAEEVAEKNEKKAKSYPRPDRSVRGSGRKYNDCIECASEHRRLAEWLKELKQLREQEPCEDCISRQAAIAVADYADYTGLAIEDVKMVTDKIVKGLKQLPPVTPAEKVGQWIPVSERLPKEDNEVLITIKSCGELYVCHSVYRDGLFWQKNFEYNSYRNPIAWMPLPEPYKASPTGDEVEE